MVKAVSNFASAPLAHYEYEPSPSGSKQNSDSTETENLDEIAPEKSIFLGFFNDGLKTIAKILTGSLLTDIVKGLLRDKNLTWQQIISKNMIDSFLSRLATDISSSGGVRLFSGKYFLPYLAPELSSQLFVNLINLPCRALTASHNVNKDSAKNNQSQEEKALKNEIDNNPSLFIRFSDKMQGFFDKFIAPKLEKFFLKPILGIEAGQVIKDSDDKEIIIGINPKTGKNKYLKSNAKVDLRKLLLVTGSTFFGSFFLPRSTTSQGFEKSRSLLRTTCNILWSSLCRLNTTLLHMGAGMHRQAGKNFDACFKSAITEKTIVPFVQYLADGIGSLLATIIPINGASLANIFRLITEIPATYLSSALLNVAKEDRMPEDWIFIANKLAKPLIDGLYTGLYIPFALLSKYVYAPLLGFYDPKIKNMYGVDIRSQSSKEKENTSSMDELDAKYPGGIMRALRMFAMKFITMPFDCYKLMKESAKDSKKYEKRLAVKIQAHEETKKAEKQALIKQLAA